MKFVLKRRNTQGKIKKIVVPVILIALAVSGTYLMLTNKAYSEAGTAVRYSTDSSDTSNYAHFANGIVRYNRGWRCFFK